VIAERVRLAIKLNIERRQLTVVQRREATGGIASTESTIGRNGKRYRRITSISLETTAAAREAADILRRLGEDAPDGGTPLRVLRRRWRRADEGATSAGRAGEIGDDSSEAERSAQRLGRSEVRRHALDPKAFRLGLWLVLLVTPVIWTIAAVFGLLALAPGALLALGRRLAGRPRTPLSAGSGIWDEWLDSPGRHDR
jgi:hypothetical protein